MTEISYEPSDDCDCQGDCDHCGEFGCAACLKACIDHYQEDDDDSE